MEFTKRFNEILKSCGKSQAQIAKELNVSKQCVNDYKTGKTVPSIIKVESGTGKITVIE